MATAFRRFARTCFQIAAERNHRTAVKLSSRHGRPLVLAVRSVAGCTEQCCRENQVTRCWKCNTKHVHGHPEFFCRECEVIQPPEEDATYFEIMDRYVCDCWIQLHISSCGDDDCLFSYRVIVVDRWLHNSSAIDSS